MLPLFFLLASLGSSAQGVKGIKVKNMPNFDQRRFHFGFLLSYNTSDFYTRLKPTSAFGDSLLEMQHQKQPGFNLGIVASLNMTKNLSLRFLPTLSLGQDPAI
ncbi:MAG: hypothetical protein IPO10_18410 [Flavobacteriales bacterium]|nr:hypothetical protein [Flavobacteriales bacterium]